VTEIAARHFAAAEAALEQSLAEVQAWREERFIAYALQRLVEVYAATEQHELAWNTAATGPAQHRVTVPTLLHSPPPKVGGLDKT
jgi:hypothetical protein